MYGDADKIAAYLTRDVAQAAPRTAAVVGQSLRDATEDYLKTLLGEQIKLAVDRIDRPEEARR